MKISKPGEDLGQRAIQAEQIETLKTRLGSIQEQKHAVAGVWLEGDACVK